MLKRLLISGFRGFRSLEADVDPVTAFLGPNSSGKTTVLQAIRLATSTVESALAAEDTPAQLESIDGVPWVRLVKESLVVDVEGAHAFSTWRALFLDQNTSRGSKFSVHLVFDEADPVQEVFVEFVVGNNDSLKRTVRVRSARAAAAVHGRGPKSPVVGGLLREALTGRTPLAIVIPPFYGTVRGEEYRATAVVDRMLGSGDQTRVVRNLISRLSTERFESMNAFLQETLGARITYRTSGDALQTESPLRTLFSDTNGDIEISAAGAGLVNLMALYAAIASARQSAGHDRSLLLLLDEPEAHLDPRLQARSIARLASLVTQEFGSQLLVATHSVDILNRLAADGHGLVRCDRSAALPAVRLVGHDRLFDDLATWADLTPYTAINFLASRRVLFCEGKDELQVLPTLAAARFRNDPARLARFREWALVELHGAANAGIAGLLQRLLASDAVRARAGAAFEVFVVLDRDYERTPGIRPLDERNPHQGHELVWGRHSLESLLLEPGVLTHWVRAFLPGPGPGDLAALVERACAAADANQDLNDDAVVRLATAMITKLVREGAALTADHGRATTEAFAAAQRMVRSDPAAWQTGKLRSAFVLGRIKAELGALGAHLPVQVVKLVHEGSIPRLANPVTAVPHEAAELLDRLTAARPAPRPE